MEWPPRSGNQQEFPEVDRADWFDLAAARKKILPAQAELLDRSARSPERRQEAEGQRWRWGRGGYPLLSTSFGRPQLSAAGGDAEKVQAVPGIPAPSNEASSGRRGPASVFFSSKVAWFLCPAIHDKGTTNCRNGSRRGPVTLSAACTFSAPTPAADSCGPTETS